MSLPGCNDYLAEHGRVLGKERSTSFLVTVKHEAVSSLPLANLASAALCFNKNVLFHDFIENRANLTW